MEKIDTAAPVAGRARRKVAALLLVLLAAGVSGCSGVSVQPSDVDFGGNGLSHGQP